MESIQLSHGFPSGMFTAICVRYNHTGNTFSLNQSTGALVLNEMVEVLKTRAYEIEIMVVNIRMGRGSLCTSSRKKWSGHQSVCTAWHWSPCMTSLVSMHDIIGPSLVSMHDIIGLYA